MSHYNSRRGGGRRGRGGYRGGRGRETEEQRELKEKYRNEWTQEQRILRSQMVLTNDINWVLPSNIVLKYSTSKTALSSGFIKKKAIKPAQSPTKKKKSESITDIGGEIGYWKKAQLKKREKELIRSVKKGESVDPVELRGISSIVSAHKLEPGSKLNDLIESVEETKESSSDANDGEPDDIEEDEKTDEMLMGDPSSGGKTPGTRGRSTKGKTTRKGTTTPGTSGFKADIRLIGAMAMSELGWDKTKAVVCLCVYQYPCPSDKTNPVYTDTRLVDQTLPYIPYFRAFREETPILEMIEAMKTGDDSSRAWIPDVLLVLGHGYFHKERCGLASQIGVKSGIPTVGVAEKPLFIPSCEPSAVIDHMDRVLLRPGHFENIYSVAYRQRADSKRSDKVAAGLKLPNGSIVYVSVGNRVDLETALQLVYLVSNDTNERPEPLELAYQACVDKKQGLRSGRARGRGGRRGGGGRYYRGRDRGYSARY